MYNDKHLPAGNLYSNPIYTTVLSITDAIIKVMKFGIWKSNLDFNEKNEVG